MTIENRRAYLIGGGIGSLAAAAFMIRDGGMTGARITIYEAGAVMGGAWTGPVRPISATPCAADAC